MSDLHLLLETRCGLSMYARALLLDEAGLRRALTHPVLLWEAPNDLAIPAPLVLDTQVAGTAARPRSGEPLVLPLRKAGNKANAFSMGITVGRTASNDVQLEDPSVSRFHAYFQQGARDGKWRLVDAESANGTWLGAVKLAPSRGEEVADGQPLRFGDVEVRFLEPDALLSHLAQHLRR